MTIENIENSIITIKPTTTHIIKLNNYEYEQLQEIHKTDFDPNGEEEFDPQSTIHILIHIHYIMRIMLEEGLSYHDAVNKVLFGQTTPKKEE